MISLKLWSECFLNEQKDSIYLQTVYFLRSDDSSVNVKVWLEDDLMAESK